MSIVGKCVYGMKRKQLAAEAESERQRCLAAARDSIVSNVKTTLVDMQKAADNTGLTAAQKVAALKPLIVTATKYTDANPKAGQIAEEIVAEEIAIEP